MSNIAYCLSYLHTLSRGLKWRDSDLIALMDFWAYLDDTGQEDHRFDVFLGVGGGVATLAHWEEVDMLWKRACDDAGIGSFHVKSFSNFEKKHPDKARILIDKLVVIVRAYVRPLGAFGGLQTYRKLRDLRGWPRHRGLDFAAQWCFEHLANRVSDHDKVHVVFAKTTKYEGRVVDIFCAVQEQHPYGSRLSDIIATKRPSDERRLEVADLVISGFMRGWNHRHSTGRWHDDFLMHLYQTSLNTGDWKYFSSSDLKKYTPIIG